MATKGVVILNKVMAQDIGSLNRSVKCSGSDIDNGRVFRLAVPQTGSGIDEVWRVDGSPSGSVLRDLWMAYSPEVPVTTDGDMKFRGLHADPRYFTNLAGDVFDAFQLRVGDVITCSSPVFSNAISTNQYANAVDGYTQLKWESAQATSALSFKLIDPIAYISIATGGINNQRITAYRIECISTGYGQ